VTDSSPGNPQDHRDSRKRSISPYSHPRITGLIITTDSLEIDHAAEEEIVVDEAMNVKAKT